MSHFASFPQTQTGPAAKARAKKMRFSFIMGENEAPNTPKGSKSSGRPSLAAMDEDATEFLTPPSVKTVTAASPNGVPNKSPLSNKPATTRHSIVPRKSLTKANTSNARQSERLSTSFYEDAAEELSVIDPLASLQDYTNGNGEPRRPAWLLSDQSTDQDYENEDEDDDDDAETERANDSEEDDYDSDNDEPQEGDLVMRDDIPTMRVPKYPGHTSSRRDYLPCTRATQADTQRLKRAAMDLILYEESEDIYASLMNRLQRMVAREDEEAEEQQRPEVSVARLARRLKVWLKQIGDGRVFTGESARFVRHELEWAEWICEAARTGVMHVKTRRCACRAEWRR
jgi:hypothetical protein